MSGERPVRRGNGITFSWIAANLLLDRFLERPSPDAEIFGFDR